MFERFTDQARRVVVLAQEEARLFSHNYIGTEHLLLGLVHEGQGPANQVLSELGVSLATVRAQCEDIIGTGGSAPSGHIPFTPRSKKVLELSLRQSLALGDDHIGTEHILLAIFQEGEGVAAQILIRLGADDTEVRRRLLGDRTDDWEPEWESLGATTSLLVGRDTEVYRPRRGPDRVVVLGLAPGDDDDDLTGKPGTATERLRADLIRRRGAERVVGDIAQPAIGTDVRADIGDIVSEVGAVVVVLEPGWGGSLADPGIGALSSQWSAPWSALDRTRMVLELAVTLRRVVIPVIVDDAARFDPERLRPTVSVIGYLEPARISTDGERWNEGVEMLMAALDDHLG